MMTDKEILIRGEAFYNAHTEHILKILAANPEAPSIRPSVGTDEEGCPALWKAIHWNWFLDETNELDDGEGECFR